uniref:hypothetical protein n=1 Tax=Rhodovarius lipocyclicus TaxID=268410 RepID=UPI001F22D507
AAPPMPPPAPPPPPAPVAAAPAPPPIQPPAPRRDWLLPYAAETGAAMLRRGGSWLALFDAATETLPESLLRAGWRYSAIPGGSMLALEDEQPWYLRRTGTRWSLVQGSPSVAQTPIQALADGAAPGLIVLGVRAANRSLSVQDPVSGLPLLVGTVRQDGAQLAQPRRFVDVGLVETQLGVALLAYSDAVLLRPATDRFLVQGDGSYRLALGDSALLPRAGAAPPPGISRSFDFPTGSVPDLSQRLRAQQAGIAQAAALSRGAPRLAATETLLALGQPQEAQAMAALAQEQDPIIAAQPRAAWLLGAAALAAGRLEEAENLGADPISDETALWRGLFLAMRGEADAAAPLIARGAALLPFYPEALQRRLLPRAIEALAGGGQPALAETLLHQADAEMPGLELGRAMLAEGRGDNAAALDGYDALVQGRDRRMRAEAMRRAAELRIATGRMEPLEAARALERTLFAWRGEGEEVSTRRRIAELRRRGGDGQGALALLRETQSLYPESQAVLQQDIAAAFLDTLRQDSPVNAVALYDAFPELLPAGAQGDEALSLLADRMVALDLADRATGLLRQALDRAPEGPRRAGLGSRLAAVRLAERDAAGALAVLNDTTAPAMPDPLRRERALLAARAEVQRGADPRAAFAPLGAAGQEALAEHLTEARDFAGAAAALGQVLERELAGRPAPLASPLPPALARKVVRHAALLALAGDTAGLVQARDAHAPLLAGSPAEGPFRVLTTDPIRGLMDLPRLQNELELFRALPTRLEGLRTAEASAR